jgi:hypothetical protein
MAAKESYREKQENELIALKVSNRQKLCRHQRNLQNSLNSVDI